MLFFLILAVIFFVAVLLATNEKEGWLTTLVFGTIVYFSWGNSPGEIITWVGAHFHWLILGFIGYFAAGGAWSVFMWKRTVDKSYNQWIEAGGKAANKDEYRPSVTRYVPRIYGWITFWWASMVAYAFGELLVEFVEKIIEWLRGVYDRITDSKFK